jgi:hypothetical protein
MRNSDVTEPAALTLLEELRTTVDLLADALRESRDRIDAVARQLVNPNVTDIPLEMPFRIEQWDKRDVKVSSTICASSSLYVAHGAFQAAVESYPDQRWTLRNRAMVIRKHPLDEVSLRPNR